MAGSRKGVPNKKALPLLELAEKLKCNPFEVLIHFAKGDWEALGYDNSVYVRESKDGNSTTLGYTITPEVRAKAAMEACKYLFPQKKALQIDANSTITIKNPFHEMSLEEKIERAKEVTALLEAQKK